MKPVIYISSTIYDFADLRASLKYVLEELGYDVLLSEFNDFKKPLETNSYDGCLEALKDANYFLLLIGHRVGGYYDFANKISITQMEYREAYKLAKGGQLKILTFVRKNLWDIREDRKALEKAFEESKAASKELSEDDLKEIINHPSTFVNHAEVTFKFLKEVERAEEMKTAIKGTDELPTGNWVHTFSIFGDIMATLNVELRIKDPIRQKILTTNLKNELLGNLSALLFKDSDGRIIVNSDYFGRPARRSAGKNLDGTSQISGKKLRMLGMYLIFAAPISRIKNQFLDEAITSGEFLMFNKISHVFEPGELQEKLMELRDNTDRLRFLLTSYQGQRSVLAQEFLEIENTDSLLEIKNTKLIGPLGIQDCEQNLVKLSLAILKYLDGDKSAFRRVQLNPVSPFPETVQELENERPSQQDVINWVRSQT